MHEAFYTSLPRTFEVAFEATTCLLQAGHGQGMQGQCMVSSFQFVQAQTLHDQTLRKLLRKYDGYEISTEGDAFIVVFHLPTDALAWCAATQQVSFLCFCCQVLCIPFTRAERCHCKCTLHRLQMDC